MLRGARSVGALAQSVVYRIGRGTTQARHAAAAVVSALQIIAGFYKGGVRRARRGAGPAGRGLPVGRARQAVEFNEVFAPVHGEVGEFVGAHIGFAIDV